MPGRESQIASIFKIYGLDFLGIQEPMIEKNKPIEIFECKVFQTEGPKPILHGNVILTKKDQTIHQINSKSIYIQHVRLKKNLVGTNIYLPTPSENQELCMKIITTYLHEALDIQSGGAITFLTMDANLALLADRPRKNETVPHKWFLKVLDTPKVNISQEKKENTNRVLTS